jgi:hypothetical protein
MKFKCCWLAVAIALLASPHYAGATTVFETTGWIVDDDALTFSFDADTAPYTYVVTLSDLSVAPAFGFDFLFLSISTSTEVVDSIVGPGSFSFTASPGKTYFANLFGTGGGNLEAGNFGILVVAVPEPGTALLLGLGLAGLILRRRLSA